jgi:hypothetical protein
MSDAPTPSKGPHTYRGKRTLMVHHGVEGIVVHGTRVQDGVKGAHPHPVLPTHAGRGVRRHVHGEGEADDILHLAQQRRAQVLAIRDLLVTLQLEGEDGVEGVEGEALCGAVRARAARGAQVGVRAQSLGADVAVQAVGEGVGGVNLLSCGGRGRGRVGRWAWGVSVRSEETPST